MYISHVTLKNWRNFRSVYVNLSHRSFLIGPNASGKSNFLDVLRFLRDIAKPGGGLTKAVDVRGGISKIRCLAARRESQIELEAHISEFTSNKPRWKYAISIVQESRGRRNVKLRYEKVWRNNTQILSRPNNDDDKDPLRLTQTYLEQINANKAFREVAYFFSTIMYLHLVPQLLRYPNDFMSRTESPEDPFGKNFLVKLAKTPSKTRDSRLKKIESTLNFAVPQLQQLSFTDTGKGGIPHLEVTYNHWRPRGARQREDQFSDGTLRLIGLLWSVMEGESPLLLEEPELSLHPYIVRKIPTTIHKLLKFTRRQRQILISTHSPDLLYDKSIGGEETLLLFPEREGTSIHTAASIPEIKALLDSGMTIAEAAVPYTQPKEIHQLNLFE